MSLSLELPGIEAVVLIPSLQIGKQATEQKVTLSGREQSQGSKWGVWARLSAVTNWAILPGSRAGHVYAP